MDFSVPSSSLYYNGCRLTLIDLALCHEVMRGVLSPPYLEAVNIEHRAFKTPFSFSHYCFREASRLPQQPSEAPRDCFGLSEEKEELFTHTQETLRFLTGMMSR